MRQRLLNRAQALQLPTDQLSELLQRLHFATQPPAAIGGWLPQLLAQWQMPRRIVRAMAHPQQRRQLDGSSSGGGSSSNSSGRSSEQQAEAGRAADDSAANGTAQSAAAGPQAVQPQAAVQHKLGSVASGRLDAFYGWLPWPLTGLQGDLAVAGWDCDWIPPDRRARSQLNGSIALVSLSAFPGDSSGVEVEAASEELLPAHGGNSSSRGGGYASGLSRQPPRSRCSYARIVQAAEAAGATAVLLAAPAGRYPREANCSCPEECGAELGIPASMVPHSLGVVLRDVLRAGDRVNVSFEEEQVRG